MTSERLAVLDACVLVPMPLADTLLRLASVGLFRPKWTDGIVAELNRTLSGKFGLTPDQVARREGAMRQHFASAWIEDHEDLIPSMPNHPGDRHVLAAAVHSGSKTVVTANVRHFERAALVEYGVEAWTPGIFLAELYGGQPQAVTASSIIQASVVGVSLARLLTRLQVNAPEFVAVLTQDLRVK